MIWKTSWEEAVNGNTYTFTEHLILAFTWKNKKSSNLRRIRTLSLFSVVPYFPMILCFAVLRGRWDSVSRKWKGAVERCMMGDFSSLQSYTAMMTLTSESVFNVFKIVFKSLSENIGWPKKKKNVKRSRLTYRNVQTGLYLQTQSHVHFIHVLSKCTCLKVCICVSGLTSVWFSSCKSTPAMNQQCDFVWHVITVL